MSPAERQALYYKAVTQAAVALEVAKSLGMPQGRSGDAYVARAQAWATLALAVRPEVKP